MNSSKMKKIGFCLMGVGFIAWAITTYLVLDHEEVHASMCLCIGSATVFISGLIFYATGVVLGACTTEEEPPPQGMTQEEKDEIDRLIRDEGV